MTETVRTVYRIRSTKKQTSQDKNIEPNPNITISSISQNL